MSMSRYAILNINSKTEILLKRINPSKTNTNINLFGIEISCFINDSECKKEVFFDEKIFRDIIFDKISTDVRYLKELFILYFSEESLQEEDLKATRKL